MPRMLPHLVVLLAVLLSLCLGSCAHGKDRGQLRGAGCTSIPHSGSASPLRESCAFRGEPRLVVPSGSGEGVRCLPEAPSFPQV